MDSMDFERTRFVYESGFNAGAHVAFMRLVTTGIVMFVLGMVLGSLV
jgi:hypothetical protein